MSARAAPGPGLLDGPGGWLLAAEGAAIAPHGRTAVVADVHLGYEWARAAGGDCLPPHSLAQTLARLGRLLARVAVTRLVVAGDLTERAGPCPRTARDVRRLAAWLGLRGVELVPLRGNHDPPRRPPLPDSVDLDGWTVLHGDRSLPPGRAVFGHHHPALKAAGVSAPCFLVGDRTIALPAFSADAAGLDVLTRRLPRDLDREPLRCVAGLEGVVLDFGPLADLAVRLGAARLSR